MNKNLLAVLFAFSICPLYGHTNLVQTACHKLIAKPVVFLQTYGMFEDYTDSHGDRQPCKLLELREATHHLQNASEKIIAERKEYAKIVNQLIKLSSYCGGWCSSEDGVVTFSEITDNKKFQHEYQEKIEPVQKKVVACTLALNKLSVDWESTKKAVLKKISIAAEGIAKNMGACAVINPYSSWVETYIDPAYDITERVINQLNAEYLAK